jgi:hypothetical protein
VALQDSAGQHPVDSAIAELDHRHTESRNARQREERKWLLQLSYFGGDQWVAVDTSGRVFEPAVDPYKLKLVDNRIMPAVLQQVAKMSANRPSFTVAPRTSDESDFRGAQMGDRALEWAWSAFDLSRKRRQAILWSRVCSAGFWKICWDDRRGDPFEVMAVEGENGEQILLGSAGQPMQPDTPEAAAVLNNIHPDIAATARSKTLFTGDVAVEVRSPFSIFPDPLAGEEGLEGTDWAIEEVVKHPSWVKERYGKEILANAGASPGVLEARMPGLPGQSDGQKIGVVVREFWAKPCSEFPKGKHLVYADQQVLLEEDNPYGWLPYVMFRGTPFPGRFWPTCVTEQQISPQTELNKTLSQIAENATRIGNPSVAISNQAGIDWDGLPGSIIRFNETGMQNSIPQFIQPPEMPGYIQNRVPQLVEAMQDIAGQHDVSHGNVPTGVTAAAAINLLQEADDTRLGPDVEDMEKTLEDAGKRIVQLIARYYTDDRALKLVGDEGGWNISQFRGSMLHDNTDVKVQAGSGMPRSKAAKQAAFQEMLNLFLQYGYQMDQRTLRKALQAYDVGGLEILVSDLDKDQAKVQRENNSLMQGQQVQVRDFDNHEYEIEAHNDFRKGAEYSQLNPAIQQVVDEHVRMHEDALAQLHAQQQQAEIEQMRAQSMAQQAGPILQDQAAPPSTPQQ